MKLDVCKIRFFCPEDNLLSEITTGFHVGGGHFYALSIDYKIPFQFPHIFIEVGDDLYFILSGSLTKHSSSSSGKLEFKAQDYYIISQPKPKDIECLDTKFVKECLNLIKSDKVSMVKLVFNRKPSQKQTFHKDSYEPISLETFYTNYDTAIISSRNHRGWNIDDGIKFISRASISLKNVDPHYFKDYVSILIMLSKPKSSKKSYSLPAMPLETTLKERGLVLTEKRFDIYEVSISDKVLDYIIANEQRIGELLGSEDGSVLNMIHFYHKYRFYSQGPKRRDLIDRLYLLFKAISNIRDSAYLKCSDNYRDKDSSMRIFSTEKVGDKSISETQSIKGIIKNFYPDTSTTNLGKLIDIRNKVLKAEELSQENRDFIEGANYIEKQDNSTVYGFKEGFLPKIEEIIEISIGLNEI